MFIGGAHLRLVLHNRSILISVLSYLERKINTSLSGIRNFCEHFHRVHRSVSLHLLLKSQHVAERGQQIKKKGGVCKYTLCSKKISLNGVQSRQKNSLITQSMPELPLSASPLFLMSDHDVFDVDG